MAGPQPLLPLALLTLLPALFALAAASACSVPPDSGNTLSVIHAFGPCSPLRATNPASASSAWDDALRRDADRFAYLASLVVVRRRGKTSVPIASGRQVLQTTTYVVRASLGTPPQPLLVALDTSSDAAWVPCTGCVGCPSSSAIFTPASSTTFRSVSCGSPRCSQFPNPTCPAGAPACGFNLTYGGSTAQASVAADSLTLAADSVPDYAFGCLQQVTGSSVPPQGLLGLGRGPASLVSQAKSLYSGTFSYCLPSFRSLNFSGSLRLGPVGQPVRIKTTPLLFNPRRPSLYYVNLRGIRVGRRIVDIPPSALAFDPATGAGTVFDSGTMFTRLVVPAYVAVRDEFRRRVRGTVTSLGGFDTCYDGPIVAPAITLLFEGMNVTLPAENVMIHSTAGSTSCLAMAAAPGNVNSVLNVIASMQQQNHRLLFDVPNSRVGVARETCTA